MSTRLPRNGEFSVAFGVALTLTAGGMCAVTGHLDDEPAGELRIDSGHGPPALPIRLLHDRPRQTCSTAQTEEPSLEPALAAAVDERVDQRRYRR